MKATEDFALYHASNWRISYMKMMAQEWGWSKERIEELDQRPKLENQTGERKVTIIW